MPTSNHTTISNKLTKIVMFTCTIIILLMLVVTIITQGLNMRNSLVDKTTTLAKVIGANSKESITLRKKYQATPILETLKAEHSIQVAYIFDYNNQLFAHYFNDKHTSFADTLAQQTFKLDNLQLAKKQFTTTYNFTTSSLCLYSPIIQDGRYLGAVYLQAGLNDILINLLWLAVSAIIMLIVALGIAYLLTSRLKSQISSPLHKLVVRMKTVTQDKIYNPNKQPIANNNIIELTELQACFDEMLVQINDRQTKLREHSHHLEEQVMKRTIDLQNSNNELIKTVRKLDIAREEAIEASAAKSKFLANMGHEIRTPMIGVLGMAELLLTKATDNYQRELTRTILSSGESLMEILNDLLDFSKIEAGKLELEEKPFSPVATMESAVELLTDNAFNKGLELTTIPSPYLPQRLQGDAGRIRQIILNLLSNAIKFTDEGRIVIFMNNQRVDVEHIKLKIMVCDSGIGLSKQAKEEIFQSFTQADISTTRNYGGTGLGLAIVKQLVELMGGTVSVKSTQPHGCCFSVEIPFDLDKSTTNLNNQLTNHYTTEKALIATASPDLAQLLTQHLTAVGMTSTTVKSNAAVQQILNHQTDNLDMIFLDLSLSDSGLDSLLKNRSRKTLQKLILITQRLYQPSDSRQQELGIDHLLIKPIKISHLHQILSLNERHCPPSSANNEKIINSTPQKANILLAEDNITNQRLIQIILEQAHYKLTIVSDGAQAVEATSNKNFDLILMDCQMPVMDGYKAARIIREQSQVPIIALTAHASVENADLCYKVGMNEQLNKPFRRQQLLDIVNKFLTAEHSEAENMRDHRDE